MDTAAAVAKHRYDSCHRQEEFAEGDEIWISQGDMYHLQGNVNPKLWLHRQRLYYVIYKVMLLVYELDIDNNKVHPIISIQYLI